MKENMAKKLIFLCLILTLGCFGDEIKQVQEEQMKKTREDSNTGWFFGVGLGGGLNKITDVPDVRKNNAKIFQTLDGGVSAKIGGYYYPNSFMGMRYYYSLDLGIDSGHRNSYRGASGIQYGLGFLNQSHLFNYDLMFNTYSREENTIDFILGLGFGASITLYDEAWGENLHIVQYGYPTRFLLDLQARANVGIRWMRNQSYGLELMAKIPLTPAKQFDSTNSNGAWSFVRYNHYLTLTLDFVMEL